MARSRELRKLAQNRATSSTDKGTMARLGVLTRSRDVVPWLANAHRRTLPVSGLKPRRDLTGSAGECDAQGTIGYGNTLVDGGAAQWAFLAGLKSHVVEQGRFGECTFGDRIGMMKPTLPPAEQVQQLMRITSSVLPDTRRSDLSRGTD